MIRKVATRVELVGIRNFGRTEYIEFTALYVHDNLRSGFIEICCFFGFPNGKQPEFGILESESRETPGVELNARAAKFSAMSIAERAIPLIRPKPAISRVTRIRFPLSVVYRFMSLHFCREVSVAQVRWISSTSAVRTSTATEYESTKLQGVVLRYFDQTNLQSSVLPWKARSITRRRLCSTTSL